MELCLIFDLAVILIFLVCVIFAYKKGFIRASYNIISLALTLVLVFFLKTPFQNIVNDSVLGQSIRENITLDIGKIAEEEQKPDSAAQTADEVTKKMLLPQFLSEKVEEQTKAAQDAADNVINSVSQTVADSVIQIVSIILLFIIIRLLLVIAMRILDKVVKLPVLSFFNKTLGILMGVVNALLIIYIISAALLLFTSGEKAEGVSLQMEKTYIAKTFYDNNILLEMFIK